MRYLLPSAVLAGSFLLAPSLARADGEDTPRIVPRDSDYLVGGTIAIVSGALAILGGIPLVYFGAKHERRTTGVWLTAGGVGGSF